jgi:hypothetical protein
MLASGEAKFLKMHILSLLKLKIQNMEMERVPE